MGNFIFLHKFCKGMHWFLKKFTQLEKNLHNRWSRRSWQISSLSVVGSRIGLVIPALTLIQYLFSQAIFFVCQNIHRLMNKPTRGCAGEANQKEENNWPWSHYCLSAGKEFWYSSAHFSCWVINHLQLIFSEVFLSKHYIFYFQWCICCLNIFSYIWLKLTIQYQITMPQ